MASTTGTPTISIREVGRQRFELTDLILCEILRGIRDETSFALVPQELHNFELFETGVAALAIETARKFRHLRRHGHTARKTIDCLIATYCLAGC